MDLTRLISVGMSTAIFAAVVWLIRERMLREKYALLWLLTSVFVILLSLSRHLLESLALAVGIYYPPSLLFLVGVLFLLAVTIGHSITLSRLSDSNLRLAQEVALLRRELEEAKKNVNGERENP